MELQMTAHLIDANEALQLGLVNHITTADTFTATDQKTSLTIPYNQGAIAVGKVIECVNGLW